MKPKRCERCQAEIMFVPTVASNGKEYMPIDTEPDPAGTVELVYLDGIGTRADVLTKQALATNELDVPRYTTHFATCGKTIPLPAVPPGEHIKEARAAVHQAPAPPSLEVE